ncbi:MAG: YceI family protein [Bacteroidota bacterium]
MNKNIIVLILLIATSQLMGQDEIDISKFYPIEASHSYVGFSVKYMGYAQVRGRFETFQGTVYYDELDIKKTSISFSIDVGSIDTDLNWRDRDLKSANWFNADTFPKITFISKKVVPNVNGFNVTGDLTIKDVTQEVTLAMDPASGVLNDARGDSQVIFTGKAQVDRTTYHVEGKNWSAVREGITAVDKLANIELSILAKRINEKNYRNWVRNANNPPGKYYKLLNETGLQEALKAFDEAKAAPDSKLNAGALNTVGYMLLKEGRTLEALQVFKKNAEVFSDDSNTYDSYAEALAAAEKFDESKEQYMKSLTLNPDNQNAKEILRRFK